MGSATSSIGRRKQKVNVRPNIELQTVTIIEEREPLAASDIIVHPDSFLDCTLSTSTEWLASQSDLTDGMGEASVCVHQRLGDKHPELWWAERLCTLTLGQIFFPDMWLHWSKNLCFHIHSCAPHFPVSLLLRCLPDYLFLPGMLMVILLSQGLFFF